MGAVAVNGEARGGRKESKVARRGKDKFKSLLRDLRPFLHMLPILGRQVLIPFVTDGEHSDDRSQACSLHDTQ